MLKRYEYRRTVKKIIFELLRNPQTNPLDINRHVTQCLSLIYPESVKTIKSDNRMTNNYNELLLQIKSGVLPAVTGMHFSQDQIDEIESALEDRKSRIAEYFNSCIKPRLDPIK